jgi:3-phosphoshikimate 1-carboxyvinyltransferase
MRLSIHGGAPLVGSMRVPADKSITHRALIFSALAKGTSVVTARGAGEDNLSTARVLRDLGVPITRDGETFHITGRGPEGLKSPSQPLDCGNSGTTMRLMAGVLAGAGINAKLIGDGSLMKRPMGRVCKPLRQIGADIRGEMSGEKELAPLSVGSGKMSDGMIRLDIASAQVKSALLLAALVSGRKVTVHEPSLSRDHTERLLSAMGAEIQTLTNAGSPGVRIASSDLAPMHLDVPGDFSSAAFVLSAAVMIPGSRVTVRDVGVNGTRTGLLEIMEELRGQVSVSKWRELTGEPVADVAAQASELDARQAGDRPTVVAGDVVPRLIDELVVMSALAARARGRVEVRDATELRVKESDRIAEVVRLLAAFGVVVEAQRDGYVIDGPQTMRPAHVDVSSDHRVALTAAVLALATPGVSVLEGFDVAAVSFPTFVSDMRALGARIDVM